ncbi:hypothetical protein A234_34346 [Pseudomonas syringae pv. actinidiae ICMP 19101]|nr:hypothetical protein A234_34346 [Pseudomonas syringae pv. actinidiae ICMP 19101]
MLQFAGLMDELSAALRPFSSNPCDTVITALFFDLRNRCDGIRVSTFNGLTHRLPFSNFVPAHLTSSDIEHLVSDGSAGSFGAIKVQATL